MPSEHDVSLNILKNNMQLKENDFFYIKLHNMKIHFCEENGNTVYFPTSNDNNSNNQNINTNLNHTESEHNQTESEHNQLIMLGNGHYKQNLIIISGYQVNHQTQTNKNNVITNRYYLNNNIDMTNKWMIYQHNDVIKNTCGIINDHIYKKNTSTILKVTYTPFGLNINYHSSSYLQDEEQIVNTVTRNKPDIETSAESIIMQSLNDINEKMNTFNNLLLGLSDQISNMEFANNDKILQSYINDIFTKLNIMPPSASASAPSAFASAPSAFASAPSASVPSASASASASALTPSAFVSALTPSAFVSASTPSAFVSASTPSAFVSAHALTSIPASSSTTMPIPLQTRQIPKPIQSLSQHTSSRSQNSMIMCCPPEQDNKQSCYQHFVANKIKNQCKTH